jgi:hypothetical protein
VFAQRIPRVEAVLACDHRLSVMQGEIDGAELSSRLACEGGEPAKTFQSAGVCGTRGVQQRLRLLLELFEIRPLGERR